MDELAEQYGITPDTLREAMQDHVAGWVCCDAGSLVGFAMGHELTAEVLVLAVRPEYGGQGIGKRLLALPGEWLFAAGRHEIWLRSNPDPTTRAHGFYRRLGWKPSGEMQNDEEILVLPAMRSSPSRN